MHNIAKAIQNPEGVCFNCLKRYEHIIKISIPALGYGSSFDNLSTRIQLCFNCISNTNMEWWKLNVVENEYTGYYEYEDEIIDFVKSMPLSGQELFFNRFASGASIMFQMEAQDWIDYKMGILSHQKCKEYGLYSPDEIKAYKERFPKCQHVVNKIYDDGSRASWCVFLANGEYNQKCSKNPSDKCYNCSYFQERKNSVIENISEGDFNDWRIYYISKLKEDVYKDKFEQ